MAGVTAAQVKELRDKTGAGMMDAKKALTEAGGNMDEAVNLLRKKGLSTAEKKSSRTAAEGLVAVAIGDNKGAIVEVNAETDFVARNSEFQDYVSQAADVALDKTTDDVNALADADFGDGNSVKEALTNLIAKIGENMTLRRVDALEVSNGVVAGYVHNSITDNMGKIGVLVALESDGDKEKLQGLGKKIAMHVAAAFPKFLKRDEVDAQTLDAERKLLSEQARESGKPENIIEKMVEGRMRKFYEEVCLLDQTFVIDNETKISDVLKQAKDDVGGDITLTGFVRYQLGEGIEKKEENFAEEVAAAVNA